jgi:predicted metal-dependent peptidase
MSQNLSSQAKITTPVPAATKTAPLPVVIDPYTLNQMAEHARSILINQMPFYACMLQKCEFRWDDRVGTAGVRVTENSGVELAVARPFFYGLSDLARVGLLLHELLHLLHEHLRRGLGLDGEISNIAMDIAINQYIPEPWMPPNPCRLKNVDPRTGAVLWDLKPWEMFEVYYLELMKNEKKIKESMPKTMDNHDWQKEGKQEGKGAPNGKTMPTAGQPGGQAATGQVSDEVQKLIIDALINDAAKECNSRFPGKVPAHVDQIIRDLMAPAKRDWKKETRAYIGRNLSVHTESTRTKLNRRLGFAAPGYRRSYSPVILVGVDCSGSVSNPQYVAFMSELRAILKNQDDKTEIVFFDSRLVETKLKLSELRELPKRPACGGTDFQPVIDYATEVKPDLLIIFTDADAYVPTKPKFPVLWAIVGNKSRGDHLFGKVISIDTID